MVYYSATKSDNCNDVLKHFLTSYGKYSVEKKTKLNKNTEHIFTLLYLMCLYMNKDDHKIIRSDRLPKRNLKF